VMGSLSFTSLRAKSAENLLHFGKTKKATEAEVTLMIQVPKEVSEDGMLKLGRDLKNDGTSVYRVNTQRSTRLNTLDSLSAINIYPYSHNIVRQGDIVKFVNMSPKERRELVEVVAGIEMYEKKKQKALTDLAEVETKTQKVDAVHAERMRIFDKLKDEKHKVERFHQLKNLEERARFSLTVKKISGLEEKSCGLAKQKSEKEEKISKTEKELDKKAGELSRLSGELEEKGMKKKVSAMMKLESLKMNYKRKEEEKNNVLREIENTKSRMSSISSQIEGLKRRKTDILTAETEKSRRVEQVHGEIIEYKKHRDEMIGRVAKSKQEYERKKEGEEGKARAQPEGNHPGKKFT
jgi:chromosome segregation protein